VAQWARLTKRPARGANLRLGKYKEDNACSCRACGRQGVYPGNEA